MSSLLTPTLSSFFTSAMLYVPAITLNFSPGVDCPLVIMTRVREPLDYYLSFFRWAVAFRQVRSRMLFRPHLSPSIAAVTPPADCGLMRGVGVRFSTEALGLRRARNV